MSFTNFLAKLAQRGFPQLEAKAFNKEGHALIALAEKVVREGERLDYSTLSKTELANVRRAYTQILESRPAGMSLQDAQKVIRRDMMESGFFGPNIETALDNEARFNKILRRANEAEFDQLVKPADARTASREAVRRPAPPPRERFMGNADVVDNGTTPPRKPPQDPPHGGNGGNPPGGPPKWPTKEFLTFMDELQLAIGEGQPDKIRTTFRALREGMTAHDGNILQETIARQQKLEPAEVLTEIRAGRPVTRTELNDTQTALVKKAEDDLKAAQQAETDRVRAAQQAREDAQRDEARRADETRRAEAQRLEGEQKAAREAAEAQRKSALRHTAIAEFDDAVRSTDPEQVGQKFDKLRQTISTNEPDLLVNAAPRGQMTPKGAIDELRAGRPVTHDELGSARSHYVDEAKTASRKVLTLDEVKAKVIELDIVAKGRSPVKIENLDTHFNEIEAALQTNNKINLIGSRSKMSPAKILAAIRDEQSISKADFEAARHHFKSYHANPSTINANPNSAMHAPGSRPTGIFLSEAATSVRNWFASSKSIEHVKDYLGKDYKAEEYESRLQRYKWLTVGTVGIVGGTLVAQGMDSAQDEFDNNLGWGGRIEYNMAKLATTIPGYGGKIAENIKKSQSSNPVIVALQGSLIKTDARTQDADREKKEKTRETQAADREQARVETNIDIGRELAKSGRLQQQTPKLNIADVFNNLTTGNDFGLEGKRSVLENAWQKASKNGQVDESALEAELKDAGIKPDGIEIVKSWAMEYNNSLK